MILGKKRFKIKVDCHLMIHVDWAAKGDSSEKATTGVFVPFI